MMGDNMEASDGKALRHTSPEGWELRGGGRSYQPKQDVEEWGWEDFVKIAEQSVRLAWSLCADNASIFKAVGGVRRMEQIEVGDMVCEITSMGERSMDGKRLGRLLETGTAPICTAEEWVTVYGGEVGEAAPEARFWRVQTPIGDILWTNARFVRVPDCWQAREAMECRDLGGRMKTARRCPDCGVTAYGAGVWPPGGEEKGWWVFGPDGVCRVCKSGRAVPTVE